jgi:hypothetical protein
MERGLVAVSSKTRSYAARGSVAKTPFFLEHFLSGGDNGRGRRFRAQSQLRGKSVDRLLRS